ncbi:MAG: carboxyl transferase domain-containing protein [Solirubrobacterales bacterium]
MEERLEESGLTSRSGRVALTAVATDLVDVDSQAVSQDPLQWPGYQEQLRAAEARSGETESVVVAEGTVGGRRVTLVGFNFDFLGGSMGEATGERIAQAFAHSRTRRQPLVSLVASGGARMQEGMRSLVQMQRLAAACAEARTEGIPHISVVRNPTTGGVWVSLASTADVILGVTGANVSFAGSRVRGDAGEESRPFTAGGKQASGFIDAETSAEQLPAMLDRYIALLGDRAEPAPCPVPDMLAVQAPPATGWQAVQRARSEDRPRALAYLDRYFTERVQISGDRAGGKDEGMLCGFGRRDGRTVAYAAQTGSRNSAAGFRTATRLFRLAERLRIPILTLIDTPGAEHTAAAEQAGIGTAIGETFVAVSELSVPVTSLVIGEGGSGGALALAAPGRLWATPDSYFSVIAPEGAAAILFRDSSRAADAADNLRLGPADLVALGISAGVTES